LPRGLRYQDAMTHRVVGLLLLLMNTAQAVDWRAAADARLEKNRKSDFTVRVLDAQGRPAADQPVTVRQTRSAFRFGTCIAGNPASTNRHEVAYWRYVREHFNTVVCENAMKWYAIGAAPDRRRWTEADRLLKFADENQLAMRGHCLFWSKQKFVQRWVQDLSGPELRLAVDRHLEAVVPRYAGRLIAWDVYNEMLDGRYYESRLGDEIAVHFFRRARQLDPQTPLFVNEYNIVDSDERTGKLIALIRRLQAAGVVLGGIGIQEHAAERLTGRQALPDPEHPERAHMGAFDPAGMVRRLDRLAELGLPIHLTEVSFCTLDQQQRADALEIFYRVAYSHPAVEAVMLWGFWEKRHFLKDRTALVDANWKNTPAGDRLDQLLLRDWRTTLTATTDATGTLRFRGFHGTYDIGGVQTELLAGKTNNAIRLP
jgi:GH35 family endo-1,4-beta-xylanase